MTSPTQPKPTPIPAVLVYGTPTSPELTQASWFRAEDVQAAKAAAVALKFSVIDIQTEADRALTVGVHEGVLKGSGRMIVGSVASEVYRRIEDHVRKISGVEGSRGSASTEAAVARPKSEQTTNSSATATAATSSAPVAASPASPDSKPPSAATPVAASTARPRTSPPPHPVPGIRCGSAHMSSRNIRMRH